MKRLKNCSWKLHKDILVPGEKKGATMAKEKEKKMEDPKWKDRWTFEVWEDTNVGVIKCEGELIHKLADPIDTIQGKKIVEKLNLYEKQLATLYSKNGEANRKLKEIGEVLISKSRKE
jgi:hypothetical protein